MTEYEHLLRKKIDEYGKMIKNSEVGVRGAKLFECRRNQVFDEQREKERVF